MRRFLKWYWKQINKPLTAEEQFFFQTFSF